MKKDNFSSRLGVIAAATGAAVGLGNVWKFPYEAGQNGGGLFLLFYILCLIIVGIPVLVSVFLLGRTTGKNAVGAMKEIAPKSWWYLNGIMGLFGAFLLLAFYTVVSGWVLGYIYKAGLGEFSNESLAELGRDFAFFIANPIYPVIFQGIFMILTAWIISVGVTKGIERVSFILMPILFILILFMDINAIGLDGGGKGFRFLFYPDFSKLQISTVLSAMGQAFFSLSIGLGAMVIYGSYIRKKENILRTGGEIAVTSMVISMLAGIAIFPALFAYGISPKAGPALLFITIPHVFSNMAGGSILSIVFFFLLGLAALTSSISILEILVAYFVQEFKVNRRKASIILSFITFCLTVIFSWSFGILSDWKVFGKSIFDLTDYLISNIMLPIGGLVYLLFTAYVIPKKRLQEEFLSGFPKGGGFFKIYWVLIRYISPAAVVIILLQSIISS